MKNKTAEVYRQMAADCRSRRAESFERCDTDGFLSQWASDYNARKFDLCADLVENDYLTEFSGLYFGEERIPAKVIDGKFGQSWLLREDAAERFGRKYIPCGTGRIAKNLGLSERKELAPAWVANGKNQPYIFRNGCEWGTDSTLVTA